MTTVRRRRYPPGRPTDSWTVGQLRAYVQDNAREGVCCTACGRRNQYYRRSITGEMARSLIEYYRACERRWGHRPTVLREAFQRSGDECKLRFWGLFEEDPERVGWWRVTARGERFVLGEIMVREFAFLYNNEFKGYDGGYLPIWECLDNKFDYDDLMGHR